MSRAFVEVVPGVLVMTSRRYLTTSTVVLAGAEALVIDPSWDADEVSGVAGVVESAGATCAAGLATHEHYDHVLWPAELPAVPRWATPWTCDHLARDRDALLAPLVGDLPDELIALAGHLTPVPEAPRQARDVPGVPYPRRAALPAGYALPWRAREVLLHEHDAHARGHLAVEVVDAGLLVAGDMLSDVELPYPDHSDPDLTAYLVGLDRLADVVRRCRVLVPGHGSPTDDPMGRLDADRRYLEAILAGREADDPRLADPDNQSLHATNVERARATPG